MFEHCSNIIGSSALTAETEDEETQDEGCNADGAATEVSVREPPEGCNTDGADTEVSVDEPPQGCNAEISGEDQESGGYDMLYSSSSS